MKKFSKEGKGMGGSQIETWKGLPYIGLRRAQ